MAEEIASEKDRISNFEGLMTLTLDWVILHIVMHHSSTSTYMPNFIETKEFLQMDGWTVPSSKSRDTKTRTNLKNPARSNLDIVP